jgi:hypothetical protein
MLVVHIGLGKTATTSLQRFVFPKLAQLKSVSFNDPRLWGLLTKNQLVGLSSKELDHLKRSLHESGNNLISLESLVGWNPHYWEAAADQNLEIFGENAVVIVSVREPVSYLTSVYQQIIHQGNVKNPRDFFVDGKTYSSLKKYICEGRLEYFDVDSFDLEKLFNIYQERFKSVHFVPLEDIGTMNFLRNIYELNEGELEILRSKYKESPRANRAYSKIGMSLTFLREHTANIIGLRSIGSDSRLPKFDLPDPTYTVPGRNISLEPFNQLTFANKVRQLPRRIFRRLRSIISVGGWRGFIQNRVDKLIPYVKYELPDNIYFNEQLVEKNRDFLRGLRERL